MLKRTLAILVTSLAVTSAFADPPATAPGRTDGGLLDDLRVIISEVVVDIRDGLSRLFHKPAPSQCRPAGR